MSASPGQPLDAARPTHPRVLHLDHTTVAGGAEFALLRMLQAGAPWSPYVMIAPTEEQGLGVYAGLPDDVPRRFIGVRQPAGVSWGGFGLQVVAAVRLVAQAIATRMHRAFRRADLVDANTARAAAYGALAARLSRVPFVVHVRDMTDADALGRTGRFLMTRVILPRADGIISDTHPPLDSARPYLRPDALVSVIPSASGIRLRQALPPRAPGGVRVGMLARIDPWKGQRLLLDAFAEAFAGTDARLEFAGAAPFGHDDFLAELHERTEELGITDQVVFHGHVSDVDALIEQWDIAVQASTRPEPLGQNVLQYLAAGRAVVVADEGGPTEWVRDDLNGLQFAARDVHSLAGVLARLGSDAALRARLGAAAAATPGLLDDAEVAEAHADFYREVIEAVRVRSTRAQAGATGLPRRGGATHAQRQRRDESSVTAGHDGVQRSRGRRRDSADAAGEAFTVLVVCTGNVNRSALGAVLLDTWSGWYLPPAIRDRVRIGSAGLRAPAGSSMGPRAQVIAEALGADGSRHRAVQITDDAIRAADLVLVSSARQREASSDSCRGRCVRPSRSARPAGSPSRSPTCRRPRRPRRCGAWWPHSPRTAPSTTPTTARTTSSTRRARTTSPTASWRARRCRRSPASPACCSACPPPRSRPTARPRGPRHSTSPAAARSRPRRQAAGAATGRSPRTVLAELSRARPAAAAPPPPGGRS